MLTFQNLDVYKCSIQFLARTVEFLDAFPRGFGGLADQLRRAALSVPLNVAEGAGRISAADAARHYAIARGSAMECAAIVDALVVLQAVDDRQHTSAVDLLGRIVAMLTKMIR
jgi:four helix bundle protein